MLNLIIKVIHSQISKFGFEKILHLNFLKRTLKMDFSFYNIFNKIKDRLKQSILLK